MLNGMYDGANRTGLRTLSFHDRTLKGKNPENVTVGNIC
jgi:hypothetical protein